MENFEYYNPAKLYFGKNVVENLGKDASLLGKKALLAYGKGSIKANGIYDQVVDQLKINHFLLLILILLISGCESEDDSSEPSSGNQHIIGNWAGVNGQGLPVNLRVESMLDTVMITSYDYTYIAGDDTIHLGRNDPQGLGLVANDTFNINLVHNNQNKGKSRGRFWNTNYLSGTLEVNESGYFFDFNYSASKIGYSATIHSAPQYSLVFEDGQVADYTYVKSFYATYDSIHQQDNVILSSIFYIDPLTSGEKEDLLEIRLGSLVSGYNAADFRQLVSFGIKPFSIGATDGVEIIYHDKSANYKTWSTSFGAANQQDSQFNISELFLLSGSDTSYLLYKFNATFNCILYDAAGNDKKVLKANCLGLIGAWF